jgi:hypothetical protein
MSDDLLTEEDLKAIEKRLQATTPGPWLSMVEGRDHCGGSSFILTGSLDHRGPDIELSGATGADQDFIASCRQDVPRLVTEVRRLRRLLAER